MWQSQRRLRKTYSALSSGDVEGNEACLSLSVDISDHRFLNFYVNYDLSFKFDPFIKKEVQSLKLSLSELAR